MEPHDKLLAFLRHKAYNLRVNSILATTQAGSGHVTSALSVADLVAALFFNIMSYDPLDLKNPNNDRFILSKGHAAPVLYAAWYEAGVLSKEELMTLRQFDSVLEGHPTPRFNHVEVATGSLGMGLSIGLGMALTAKLQKRDFKTYVLMGDSEMTEGAVWEAAQLAAYYKTDNLIALVDNNKWGQSTEVIWNHDIKRYEEMWDGFGWHVLSVDGHDMHAILHALDTTQRVAHKPTVILAYTYKGYGVDKVQDKNGFHGKAFKKEELEEVLENLKERFPEEANYKSAERWTPNIPIKQENRQPEPAKKSQQETVYALGQMVATRVAYGDSLVSLGGHSARVLSLDAEVKNSTYAQTFEKVYPERFIQCFVAEQNMIGMAMGMCALGEIPFVSTFAVFFNRAFDQLRMAAISKLPLRTAGSHAGVSIGQDGPSQMGLEDIALMRLLPESVVLYPCDAVSTYKLMKLMLNYTNGISYMRLTRAETPVIYDYNDEFTIGGSHVLKQSSADRAVVVAAGITLFEALKAYELLQKEGISIAVIDLYSVKPLDSKTIIEVAQKSHKRVITVEDHYRAGGIGEAVSAALCNTDITLKLLAVDKLPRSGKPEELLSYEGIDAAAIIQTVKELLEPVFS